MKTTRSDVINWGIGYLNEIGTGAICKVCISNGGSCCMSCSHLMDGIGCQSRNTSCTSWLCGFLMLIFHDAGILREWRDFWNDIPGLDYRRDDTPTDLEIERWMPLRDLRLLAMMFSEGLKELASQNGGRSQMVRLNNILFNVISTTYLCNLHNEDDVRILNRKLSRLSKVFRQYNAYQKMLELRERKDQQ